MATEVVGSAKWDLDLDDGKFNSKAAKASETISGMEKSFGSAELASVALAAGLAAVGAAAVAAIGFGVRFAADLETMTQGFVTLLGSTEKANAAIAMIKADAMKTPFELRGLVQANQLLTSVTHDADKSERFLLNIGKALTAMGKGQPELDRIIVNLQQIGAVGHASSVDIKQFAFAGIPIYDMLNERIKGTGKNLDDMIANQEITFSMLTDLFNKAGEGSGKFSKAFELQGGTFNQVLSNFKDNIGITASELVKQLGIFDMVKNSLSDLTTALGKLASPQGIAAIMQVFTFLRDNFPIIAGAIIGALIPAIGALYLALLPLIASFGALVPFIVVGGAIGLGVQALIAQFGGWNNMMIAMQPTIQYLGTIFSTVILPLLQMLWGIIVTQLVPALQQLWTQISPVLIPVLQFLGAVILGVVITAIVAFIAILISLTKAFAAVVSFISAGVSQIAGVIHTLAPSIQAAVGGIRDILVKPFNDAWNTISDLVKKMRDALDFTKRHSPSVLDIVSRGVDLVSKEFESLADVTMPSISHDLAAVVQPTQNGTNQTVTVNIDKVSSMQDVDSISREIGFKLSTQ